MNEPDITVLLVNWYSTFFLKHLVPNLCAKAAHPMRLHFLLLDNTNGLDEDIQVLCESLEQVTYTPVDSRGLTGSWGHAHALREGLEQISSEYLLTIDPDVHVFAEGWDQQLVEAVRQSGALAVGAPYPQWKLGKYHDFPSPVLALHHTEKLRRLQADWQPFDRGLIRNAYNWTGRQIVRLGAINSRQRCIDHPGLLRTGQALERLLGIVGPDTGYRIAAAARSRGEEALVFDDVYANQPSMQGDEHQALRDLARLFEVYAWEGTPFMTHMGKTKYFLYETEASYDDARWLRCVAAYEEARSRACVS